ncbi:CYTH domain-containing protein [Algibacillus agarilyticus]|uniref:CYTH domain-containing protein n=1 Tax=Algibacillus agarilyticus TaxID=2234133 RepID=UPI000DD081C2|nr:CYTH and CHAD domain-containing protein [Algibacillus agarilyticus]
METEIELKFFIAPFVDNDPAPITLAIDELVADIAIEKAKSCKRLVNTYFETPDQLLRSYDFGLRVRAVDGYTEQTIKTAGTVIGGLHKRPEYNVEINSMRPDLSLFPADIWPEHAHVSHLQEQLKPLFTTNFRRTKWELEHENSHVELVMDFGEVEAGDESVAIREIEIELVDGDVRALFSLAKRLTDILPLRLSNDSKAARGYRLYANQLLKNKSGITPVKAFSDTTIEQCFINTIQHGLSYWQTHEEVYLANGKLSSLAEMLTGIELIKHAFSLFSKAIPKQSTQYFVDELDKICQAFAWLPQANALHQLAACKGAFKKRMTNYPELVSEFSQQKAAIVSTNDIEQLLHSKAYSQLIIDLVKWLYEKAWRCYNDTVEANLNSLLIEQVDTLQQQSWQSVKQDMPINQAFTAEHYFATEANLRHSLMTGLCVGQLYSEEHWQVFRAPWLDILQGINELHTYKLLANYLVKNQGDKKLLKWCNNKTDTLISVMERSRISALDSTPYWLE